MEKETLEETAYQARRDYQDEVGKDGMNECIMLDAMKIQKGFELGAKWQAERMYSQAEVIKIVEKSRETGLTAEFLLLTEQFKKK